MKVSAVTVDPVTGLPVVLLEPAASHPHAMPLVISVGTNEASAIATELKGIELERPCTHQLMCTLLADAGAQVERVEIYGVVNSHYHMRIHLRLPDGKRITRDGRPSDALALALHTGARIEAAAEILADAYGLDRAGGRASERANDRSAGRVEYFSDLEELETLDELDALKELELLDELHDLDDLVDLDDLYEPDADDADDGYGEAWAVSETAGQAPAVMASSSFGCADLAEVSDEAFGKWKM